MRHTYKILAVAMLFGAAAAPLPTHAATGDATQAVFPPSVLAFDQKATDGKVKIDYAHMPKAGYVAIYAADKNGKPTGKPLGYSKIKAGDHRQLTISLNEQPKSGDALWISLYKDADNDPSFNPGEGDKAVWSKSEMPAESKIMVK
ncbi:MAG: hypothetical protein RIC14_01730 [Filomicrobium sp.]